MSDRITRFLQVYFETCLGFLIYIFLPRKKIILIASAMRSGSTLLKALLAEAPDVSNLPEINLSQISDNKFYFYYHVYRLSPKRIIVLKRPCPFGAKRLYPSIPNIKMKMIILVRNPTDVVLSLEKRQMEIRRIKPAVLIRDRGALLQYWCYVYESLLNHKWFATQDQWWLRYEDLTDSPIEETKSLFRFIGSKQSQGVDRYHLPPNYLWRWGRDDGGEKMKRLIVQKSKKSIPGDEDSVLPQLSVTKSIRVWHILEALKDKGCPYILRQGDRRAVYKGALVEDAKTAILGCEGSIP